MKTQESTFWQEQPDQAYDHVKLITYSSTYDNTY